MDIHVKKTILPNGVRLLTIPKKDTEAVAIEVMFNVGSRHETDDIQGIAHILEHMAFKGTKKRPEPGQIDTEIDAVGGQHNAYTYFDITGYWIYLPADKLSLGLDILSDMLNHSLFDATELEKEKGPILEEIKMGYDQPTRFLFGNLVEKLFPHTGLGHKVIGTPDSVRSITREQLLDFYNHHYQGSNIVIAIAGHIPDEPKLIDEVTQLFGNIPNDRESATDRVTVDQDAPQCFVFPREFQQVSMFLTFRSFGRDAEIKQRYTRALLRDILGGYSSARLFSEIRQKRGLCYSIYTDVDSFAETGLLGIISSFDRQNLGSVLEATSQILRDLKEKGPTDEELIRAKENNIGSLKMATERSQFLTSNLGEQELFHDTIEDIDTQIKHIQSVSREDIQRLAQEQFLMSRCTLGVTGPVKEAERDQYLSYINL